MASGWVASDELNGLLSELLLCLLASDFQLKLSVALPIAISHVSHTLLSMCLLCLFLFVSSAWQLSHSLACPLPGGRNSSRAAQDKNRLGLTRGVEQRLALKIASQKHSCLPSSFSLARCSSLSPPLSHFLSLTSFCLKNPPFLFFQPSFVVR